MSRLLVRGGGWLNGEVHIKAAKNAVLPILAATMLTDTPCVISDVPDITDIHNMLKIMQTLGSKVAFENGDVIVDNSCVCNYSISADLAKELRSSVFLLGAVLARCKKAAVAYPGGCDIGVRPVDIHLKGLQELGVAVEESHGIIYCDAGSMRCGDVMLDFPSVGATENIIMAATFCKGITRIRNAAKEPEVVDLQNFINAMGGKVHGAGGSVIEIEGVTKLSGIEYTPIPDRIAAGTFVIATAVCGGDVSVNNCVPEHLQPLLFKLNKTTCKLDILSDKIHIKSFGRVRNFEKIETQPYPGFPTDLQSQAMVLMCVSEGTGVIVENIFETRFKPVRELIKMGACITVKDRTAIIKGVPKLEGASVCAGDLRGGAALAIAAVKADGYSVIDGLQHIDRGYEHIETTLCSLGADVKRIT